MIFSAAPEGPDVRYAFGDLENFTAFYDEMVMLCLPKIDNITQPKLFNKSDLKYFDLNSFESSLLIGQLLYVPVLEADVLIGAVIFSYLNDNLPDDTFIDHEAISWVSSLSNFLTETLESPQAPGSIEVSFGHKLAAIYNRDSLEGLIKNELKNSLNYLSSTIFLFSPEKNTIQNFFKHKALTTDEMVFENEIKFGSSLPSDTFLSKIFYHDKPLILDFKGSIPPPELAVFMSEKFKGNFNTGILINLFRGSDIVGNWVMLFENRKAVSDKVIRMVENIADRMTMAVSNIIAEEAVTAAKFENDIFQAIYLEVSQTRDKNLLTNIHPQLQKLFSFTHTTVVTVEDDLITTARVYLNDGFSIARNNPRFQELIATRYPIADGVYNKAMLSNDPLVFDLEHQIIKGAMPAYMQFYWDNGIKKIITSSLQVRSKTIGVWFIFQRGNDEITAHQLQMIKRISRPLSIAVDNIRANEAIVAKEAQNERLLRLSFALTKIKSKSDLHDVFQLHLNGLMDFVETQIFLMNPDNSFHNFMSFRPNSYLETDPDPLYQDNFRLDDDCFNRIMRTDEIISYDLAVEVLKPNVSRYLLENYNNGIREKLCIKIRGEHDTIGILSINLAAKGNHQEHTLQLIKAISYQLSNAVNNLISDEKIRQREYERDLLLSLSTHIAAIRSKDDLLGVIKEQLSVLLGFRYTFLTSLNADGETVTPFLFDPVSIGCIESANNDYLTKRWPVDDGYMSQAIKTTEPLTFGLLAHGSLGKLPGYLQMNYECGITHCSIIRLLTGNKVYGFWLLMFDHTNSINNVSPNLIRGLANQISVAYLNIIANDDIIKREEEKAKLIEFSNAIASVRDKEVLAKVLKIQLAEIYGASDYVFFLINKDRYTFCPFLYDEKTELLQFPEFKSIVGKENEIKNFFFDLGLDDAQFSEEKRCVLYEDPERYKISLKVNMGDDLIGVITVWHKDKKALSSQLKLWKGVCSQLAIAISNILNNEKLKIQFEEINNYKSRLEEEKVYLQEEIGTTHNYSDIIGQSGEMEKVFKLVSQVAASDSTVLISGETGTGKELIARAIHNDSPRKNHLMVKVNCAALPATLIESELFGHERGSFTGATERRLGKFELANHGTLFLDEIGEMPLDLQVKLLRALQEKEIERIGGKGTIKVDVRIVAATNRDLEKEMDEGRFRSDLFYRLNIFPITLPPLRSRREDIPMLANYFINRFAKKAGKKINSLSIRAMQQLKQYNWPGNVRELEHLIERSVLLNTGEYLKDFEFPAAKPEFSGVFYNPEEYVAKTIDDNEREHIMRTLRHCNGKINGKSGAAAVLGVPASTLQSKIKRLGIKKEHIINN
jgi:transcriptional regulator with GAF, ATPase, and Fis domain